MKDFFLTSGIPYWLLFILTVGAVGYCAYVAYRKVVADDPSITIPKGRMLAISGALLLESAALFAIYGALGGEALWWVTSKDIGYWDKLLRVIPLLIYLVAQIFAPFAYMVMMGLYFGGKRLSVKSQFIALVVIVPVALIATRFFPDGTENMWFYIIAGAGIAAAAIYSLFHNGRAVGMSSGALYTVTSFVLCAATLLALLCFIVALFSLILEMLPVIATIIAIWYIFGQSFGNAIMRRDDAGYYLDADGGKHTSESTRNARDAQIHNRKNQ